MARAVLAEHKAKMAGYRLAARIGLRKYKELLEGPTTDMSTDRVAPSLMFLYVHPENRAVRKWMKSGGRKSYLDVGAGSGRFARLALDSGAERIVALDINPSCVDALRARFGGEGRFKALHADAWHLPFQDNSFDRVMALGNLMGNVFETFPGGEISIQTEILREMLRVAREEVVLTIQQEGALRQSLKYYRMNGFEVYAYSGGIVRWRERLGPDLGEYEGRSQKFLKSDLEQMLAGGGVDMSQTQIRRVLWTSWMVTIRKPGAPDPSGGVGP
jgi:SAM-dependent methyltransferase